MGRTNEKIARIQESYMAHATSTWLESLERSLAQMKEYQVNFHPISSQIFTDQVRLRARNSKIEDSHMMPPSQRCRKPRRKTTESRKKSDLRKPNMKNRARMSFDGCRISRRPRSIALLISEPSWKPNLNIMIDVVMS
jgi:hypothetical protein